MDAFETPRTTRDRDLRRTRRLRAGMVSAGVLGSVGVAGAIGFAAVNATHPAATTGTTSNAAQNNGQTFVLRGDDGGEGGDDGFQQSNPNSLQLPQVQPGFGSPHAQSSGS